MLAVNGRRPNVKVDKDFCVFVLVALLSVYVSVAFTVLRLRHPEMTETQLLLHTWEALTFRFVEK